MSDKIHQFWDNQTSSHNREDGQNYYFKKAREIAFIFKNHDFANDATILDLGCGAGELLEQLRSFIPNPIEAIDYSTQLVDTASQRLKDSDIHVRQADAMTETMKTNAPIWMTCGAVNQYCDEEQITKVVDNFVHNADATYFCAFDTIDPVQYWLITYRLGGSYIPKPHQNILKSVAKRILCLFKIALYNPKKFIRLRPAMGYAIDPRYWIDQAARHHLDIEIIASHYFEYRYHVILSKSKKD